MRSVVSRKSRSLCPTSSIRRRELELPSSAASCGQNSFSSGLLPIFAAAMARGSVKWRTASHISLTASEEPDQAAMQKTIIVSGPSSGTGVAAGGGSADLQAATATALVTMRCASSTIARRCASSRKLSASILSILSVPEAARRTNRWPYDVEAAD